MNTETTENDARLAELRAELEWLHRELSGRKYINHTRDEVAELEGRRIRTSRAIRSIRPISRGS